MAREPSRYHRQTLLPGFGEGSQRRLTAAKAVVLGCGALGSAVADALVRAGVGRVVIVDRDLVELTNLQRQLLFDERDAAGPRPKAEAAAARLARVNSGIEITGVVDDIDDTNIAAYAAGADVLVDGLDNFETRFLANDYAVRESVPYIYAGAVGTSAMAFSVLPRTPAGTAPWEPRATPCLRCLFDAPPPPGSTPTCETAGILGPAATLVASFEAAEALKVLTGNFDRVARTLLDVDLWANTLRRLEVAPVDDCDCCVRRRFEFLEGAHASGAVVLCGADAVQLKPGRAGERVDLAALAERLRPHGPVTAGAQMLRAGLAESGAEYELTVFPDGRAIVKGTSDSAVARALYAKYVGA